MHTGRWTEYNWRTLIPGYGEDVARFFRDSAVALWRHHRPRLLSEGAPLNETADLTICGLVGLEIESIEAGNSWVDGLSAGDVELACRHAACELNGFPLWFPRLFEAHTAAVTDFLAREIRYELAHEHPERRGLYILHDVSSSGEWAWNALGSHVLAWLVASEPNSLENLDAMLAILQGSSLTDAELVALASEKCRTLEDIPHLARWYAMWTGVDPDSSIAALRDRLNGLPDATRKAELAMTFVTRLWGGRSSNSGIRPAFQTPQHLKALYLLMHEHVKMQEDINRAGTGVYSPNLRDNAQDARNALLELLNKIPGKEAFLALTEIAAVHPEASFRPWMLHLAKTKAEQDSDCEPWRAGQVRDFAQELERTPATHRELSELARLRLLDLRDDIEDGDSSIASILLRVTDETEMRKFIGHELRGKANGRYAIPQEEEFADAKRPDLRFHGFGFNGPVPVELKLAGKWTGPGLFERLENQLCGDYLRDIGSSRGFFVLVYGGDKGGWDVPNEENRVDFQGLLRALRAHWTAIAASFPGIDAIEIIGIDLTSRGRARVGQQIAAAGG